MSPDTDGMGTGRSVVLLSGGMDSATVLAVARAAGEACYALSFDYGQRHTAELHAAAQLATAQQVAEHRIMRIDLGGIGGSALTDTDIAVPQPGGTGIPVTYVPARNTVFLSLALAWAEVLKAEAIYCGINAVDYSGYPDCRPEYLSAFQRLANLATRGSVEGHRVELRAPLLDLSKRDIVLLGARLRVDFSRTVSCYQANAAGEACGACDACELRRQGFAAAGLADPTRYQAAQREAGL